MLQRTIRLTLALNRKGWAMLFYALVFRSVACVANHAGGCGEEAQLDGCNER
jgi:hypothetical protein